MYAKLFKTLGEPTRIKILRLLAEQELCVCELEEIMDMSQPRISQHLKVLKQVGLVDERKDGQRHICSLNTASLEHLFEGFTDFIKTPLEYLEDYKIERQRLLEKDGLACERRRCTDNKE